MVKKCVYCHNEINDGRALDVCDSCGIKVWGDKMFKAIIENMHKAREKGDLFQGSINEDLQKSLNNKTNSFE